MNSVNRGLIYDVQFLIENAFIRAFIRIKYRRKRLKMPKTICWNANESPIAFKCLNEVRIKKKKKVTCALPFFYRILMNWQQFPIARMKIFKNVSPRDSLVEFQ